MLLEMAWFISQKIMIDQVVNSLKQLRCVLNVEKEQILLTQARHVTEDSAVINKATLKHKRPLFQMINSCRTSRVRITF